MPISARNTPNGTTQSIRLGEGSAEIVLDFGGGAVLTSSITRRSAEQSGLEVGRAASALVGSGNVIVGVD